MSKNDFFCGSWTKGPFFVFSILAQKTKLKIIVSKIFGSKRPTFRRKSKYRRTMDTLAKTLNLGLNDRVVIMDAVLPYRENVFITCISGTVFSIDCVLENKDHVEGPYSHDVYIQCSDLEDYKKIIQIQNEWLIYCNVHGKLQKSYISNIADDDHFNVLPDGHSGLCGYLGPQCSYHDIWAIMISPKVFTIVPVHAVNHASHRI